MSRRIILSIGEHYTFDREYPYCRLLSGNADVYASVVQTYQRLFLANRRAEDFVFAIPDKLGNMQVFLSAKEDTELLMLTADELQDMLNTPESQQGLRKEMHEWLLILYKQDLLQHNTFNENDYISEWPKGRFIYEKTAEQLCELYVEHIGVFYRLAFEEFVSLNNYFDERIEARKYNKQRMLAEAATYLTGEHVKIDAEASSKIDNNALGNLIKQSIGFYGMDDVPLTIPEYILEQQDELSSLKFLIRKANMRYRNVLLDENWYKQDSGLLFVNYQGNFALAQSVSAEEYKLILQDGNAIPLDDQVALNIAPSALVVYPGMPLRPLTKKDFINYMFSMASKMDYYNILFVSVLLGLIPILTPIITETIFSDIIPVHDYQGLATVTQVMLIAGLSQVLLNVVRTLAVLRISSYVDMSTEAAIWSRVLSMPTEFFKRYSVGELAKRVMSIKSIKTVFSTQFITGVFTGIFSIWSLLLMFYYSMKLTFMCIALWVLYLGIVAFIHKDYVSLQRENIKAANATSAKVVQIFNGLTKFRSRGAEEQAYNMWAKLFSKEWRLGLAVRWQNNYDAIINVVLPYVFMHLIYYKVAIWKIEGDSDALTSVDYMAFYAAFGAFNAALISMVPLVITFLSVPAHIDNLLPILEEAPEVVEDKKDANQLKGELKLNNISFAYPNGPEVIHDVSLQVNPGEKVAIVGTSGCGKSTLMRILLGFERPSRGQVIFDDQNLEDLSLTSVRRQLGVVLQDGKLLTGRILDNIIGTNRLTVDDAWEAARKVALDKDIEEMPMGMHTVINDSSSNISGGQRQRILLARSIVNRPVMLLLDEATSALDNTSQEIVTKSIESMNCTQIIVAHRLSTIRHCDRIFVMDKGRIIEEGSFDELMELNGVFAVLAARQLA